MLRQRFPLFEENNDNPGGGGGGKPDVESQLADFKAQLEELRTENEELSALAQDYKTQLDSRKAPPASDDDDLGTDPAKDIEAINKGGMKAIEAYIAKKLPELARAHGFIDEKTASDRIAQATRTQALAARYPDLQNPDSDLHKSVLKHARTLKGLPDNRVLEVATQLAVGELSAAGKMRQPESEEDRIRRILDQDGVVRSPSRARPEGEDLSDEEKAVIESLGISKEAFLEEANRTAPVTFGSRSGGFQGEF